MWDGQVVDLAGKNGKAWLLVGDAQLTVLILAAALTLFRLAPGPDPDTIRVLSQPIPADLLEPPPPAPAATPAINSSYRRAVDAQIASMDPEAAPPEPALELPLPTSATVRLRVATVNASLNIRQAPSLQGRIVGSAAPGAVLQASGRNGDATWLRIASADGNTRGWVFADLTETLSGTVASLPAVSAQANDRP
ncbi:MAG: SH3 domain-containing protein [Caldilineaceae bacterium]|nr:SH3 domain-containing protein [Caldilineaceae bacterium]